MASAQTLDLADRRVLAACAADCAERVLPTFEAGRAAGSASPRAAKAAARSVGQASGVALTDAHALGEHIRALRLAIGSTQR